LRTYHLFEDVEGHDHREPENNVHEIGLPSVNCSIETVARLQTSGCISFTKIQITFLTVTLQAWVPRQERQQKASRKVVGFQPCSHLGLKMVSRNDLGSWTI